MTQADYGIALTLFLLVGAVTLWQHVTPFGPLKHERLKVYRYRLFAVRDRLVLLVATGVIDEDDQVFRFLYDGLNQIIPRTKPMSVWAIVQALNESEFGKMRHDETFRQQFLLAVNHSDPGVRSAARAVFNTLAEIILDRSYFVWLSVHFTHSSLKFVSTCRALLFRLFVTESQVYEYHKTVRAMAAAV